MALIFPTIQLHARPGGWDSSSWGQGLPTRPLTPTSQMSHTQELSTG
jgi:hypothetical protein